MYQSNPTQPSPPPTGIIQAAQGGLQLPLATVSQPGQGGLLIEPNPALPGTTIITPLTPRTSPENTVWLHLEAISFFLSFFLCCLLAFLRFYLFNLYFCVCYYYLAVVASRIFSYSLYSV
jgi:hypothetical protein